VIVPIGDAPTPRGGFALGTYLLVALNVAVYVLIAMPLSTERPAPDDPLLQVYARAMLDTFGPDAARGILAQVTQYDLFVFQYGFRPGAPSPLTLVTSLFLHAGFMHLAGNMLFLWIYGDNVEYRLGVARYLLLYFGAGVAATLFHTVFATGKSVPMVGASGAISGVLGAYFIWFPRNRVRLLWLLPPFVMQTVEVPARLVLGFYLVLDNLLPFLVSRSDVGVAHGAHIGGFLAGLTVAWAADHRSMRRPPAEYVAAAPARDVPSAASTVAAALQAGRFEEAASRYFALPPAATRGVLSPEAALQLAEWLSAHGHPEAAVIVARRLLREHPNAPERAAAHVLIGETQLDPLRQPTPAYQHFLDALDLDPPPGLAERARDGVARIAALQKRQIGGPRS
jgi:membrane associated rhomboid family serine protease